MLRTILALVLLIGSSSSAVASPSEELTALFQALRPSSAFTPPGALASGRHSRRHRAPRSQDTPASPEDASSEDVDEAAAAPDSGPVVTPAAPEVDLTTDVYEEKMKRRRKTEPVFDVKEWAGVSEPLGFFDPLGFSNGVSENKMRFYRECELKHCRVSMLASIGFLIAEKFHPLWGGNINVPSYIAFQNTGLAKSGVWTVSLAQIAACEFITQADKFIPPTAEGNPLWQMRTGYQVGDIGFDPFNIRPVDKEEFKLMQTKELNNGRLSMIAIAGMVAQELATGKQLLWTPLD